MKTFLRQNRFVLLPYFVFLFLGLWVILTTTKYNLHVFINQNQYKIGNILFPFITYLGDGWIIYPLLFIFLFSSYRIFLFIGLSTVCSSLFTQLLKHTLFTNMDRPKLYFWGKYDLSFVLPIGDTHLHYTFPSGHSTIAFAVFISLALLTKNNWFKSLLFLIALLVAFSRVYLSQHFFEDIYAGSIIGTAFSIGLYYVFYIKLEKSYSLNKSLRTYFL